MADDEANNGKKLAFVAIETVPTLVVFVALVALVADVAVEAFPVKAPTKVVVDNVFVEGLKVKPVPRFGTWLPFVEEAAIKGKKVAFADDETVPTLVAFVAFVAVIVPVT